MQNKNVCCGKQKTKACEKNHYFSEIIIESKKNFLKRVNGKK